MPVAQSRGVGLRGRRPGVELLDAVTPGVHVPVALGEVVRIYHRECGAGVGPGRSGRLAAGDTGPDGESAGINPVSASSVLREYG